MKDKVKSENKTVIKTKVTPKVTPKVTRKVTRKSNKIIIQKENTSVDPDKKLIEKNKRYIEKLQKLLKLKIQNENHYLSGKSIRNGWN